MLGSNIIFQQHLCKLGQLRRSNGINSQIFGQAMKKRPTGHTLWPALPIHLYTCIYTLWCTGGRLRRRCALIGIGKPTCKRSKFGEMSRAVRRLLISGRRCLGGLPISQRQLRALSVYSPYHSVRPRPPLLFLHRGLHGIVPIRCESVCVSFAVAFQQELTSLVEGYLSEGSEVDDEVKGRQMQLLSMILSDMSEPTDVLVAKLNCDTHCECVSEGNM